MKYKLDEELKQVLISNIIFFREKLGISQYALAKMIGVTQPYMAQIESGEKEMSITVFNKLSKALGVSMNALLSADRNNASIKNINAMLNGQPKENLESMERMTTFYLKELDRIENATKHFLYYYIMIQFVGCNINIVGISKMKMVMFRQRYGTSPIKIDEDLSKRI